MDKNKIKTDERVMLTKPRHGWATLTIPCLKGNHCIALSYIEDIPIYFLTHFLEYLERGDLESENLVLSIDEEGNTQKIISDKWQTYIIDEGKETLNISNLTAFDSMYECCKSFRENLNEWSSFAVFEEMEKDYERIVNENKNNIKTMIDEIEKRCENINN